MVFQLEQSAVKQAADAHVETKEALRQSFLNFKNNTLPEALASSPNGNLTGLKSTYDDLLAVVENKVNERIDNLQQTMLGQADDQYMEDLASKGGYPSLG